MLNNKLKLNKVVYSQENVSELIKNKIKEEAEKLLIYLKKNNMILENIEYIEVSEKIQNILWGMPSKFNNLLV
jgi:hypothetical protein